MGFVLVEVVLGWGGDGGFVVHHEELVVEVDDPVHVAAEKVGLRKFNNTLRISWMLYILF